MPTISANGRSILEDAKLIIFDKDGTLIDVHRYWSAMINYRSVALAEEFHRSLQNKKTFHETLSSAMGLDLKSGRLKHEGPIGIKPRAIVIEQVVRTLLTLNICASEEQVSDLFKKVDKETFHAIERHIEVLPGVQQFVADAHQTGVKLAIATSDRTDRAEKIMSNLGLAAFFDRILGGDQIQQGKPHPESVIRLMDYFGTGPEQTAVVGDHPVDIEMGHRAGLTAAVGVLTGLGTSADFDRLECPYVQSFKEMSVS